MLRPLLGRTIDQKTEIRNYFLRVLVAQNSCKIAPNHLGGDQKNQVLIQGFALWADFKEVIIWDQPLELTEVQSVYISGGNVNILNDPASFESSSSVIGYWKFNSGDGDILYDPNIYSQDINFNESSIFFDSSYSTNTNDEMVVFGKRGFVDSIIKGPNKELVKNHQGNVLGESLGINLFKADILEVLFDNLKKSVDINQQIHWEQTIVTLSVEKNIKLRGVDIAPLNWININYKDDLKIASKLSFV